MLADVEADATELWESAVRLTVGPRLRGSQVDELLAVATSSSDAKRVEAAIYALSFSTISNRRLHELVLRLLEIVDDTASTANARGLAAEGVGNHLECTKQSRLRRTATLRLTRQLTDGAPEVRFWSAFSLGKLGAKSARAALRRLTSDQTVVAGWWTVGAEAADAIDTIEGRVQPPDTTHSMGRGNTAGPSAVPLHDTA